MTDPVLLLEQIVVHAAGRALLDVERFHVAPGDIVAVIGPNGAGKTTLLHVAALLRRPDAGAVTILGTRATRANSAKLRRALAVVFQEPLLFDIAVLANAAAALRFQGLPRTEAEARARAWLERFGVGHLTGRKARSLSGGEASRVALARAFAAEPALLFLDEPFSALDAPTRASLLPMLREQLRETGTAAVLVTHDLDEAAAFAEHIAVMDAGRIVADGPAPDLIARPPTPRVAELLGVETILPVKVTHVAGDTARVAILPAGPSLLAAYRPGLLVAGQTVILTLPAGAVRVLKPDERCPPATNCLPGVVRAIRPFASGARIVVDTPAPVAALFPWGSASAPWSIGDRVVVGFDFAATHLIGDNC